MKDLITKRLSKQIIYIVVILMLCNFIMPNYSYAADTDNGGKNFDKFIKFTTFLCDSLMQFMQNSFTSNQSIEKGDGTYNFQYSPAIIFSGTVQGLDINFITPNTDVRNINNFDAFVRGKRNEYLNNASNCSKDDYEQAKQNVKNYEVKIIETTETTKRRRRPGGAGMLPSTKKILSTYYYESNNTLYIYSLYYFKSGSDETYKMGVVTHNLTPEFLNEMNATATYTSIASELQPTIATWYNALRRIALVGLLSVLAYLGIRIVLSSSSPEGNSKYKKMLTDWLIALCLLFTLHYIMSATLVITQKLSGIFNTGTTDELLNTLRANINSSQSWGVALGEVIMYMVLVIYTVIFTFQYLRRVLYMAFFTMIAPLITLTYPIDKLNDGQAQAFNMWIREYIFNALIQVVHLVVYYTLVGSAIELVKSFPIYGIVAIGFMTQGEKIIRNMFGFNNAETVGTMGAAATGGLIVTAMNKLKSLPKAIKGSGGKSSSGENSGTTNNNVRTARNNAPVSIPENQGTSSGGTASSGIRTANAGGTGKNAWEKAGRVIRGTMKVGGKCFKPVAKATIGAGLGLTGAMIGFASGVAQGDMGAALTGATVGAAAGNGIGKGAVDAVAGIPKIPGKIKDGFTNIRDTYREGYNGDDGEV